MFVAEAGDGLLGSAVLFGLLGGVIGLRYRAQALIPATLLAVLWGVVAGWMGQPSLGRAALGALMLPVVLHAAYLVGLALRTLSGRSS
jgi:hypothetical protein